MPLTKKFIQKIDNPEVISTIMKKWLSEDTVNSIFEKIELDKNYFISYFGLKILDYFILVLSEKAEIGNCPYIEKFLEFLEEKKVSVGDVFLICSALKKSIINFVLKDDEFSKQEKIELVNEIYRIFDLNLAGVLNRFVG